MRKNVVVRLDSAAIAPDAAELRAIEGTEEFNQPFEFRVDLVTKDTTGLDDQAILTQPASLVFSREDVEICRIFGMVAEVHESLHSEGSSLDYRLRFVPRVWKASLTKKSQVFVDQSIPDIITAKLQTAGLQSGQDFELRLQKSYTPRDLVIQYEETDLHFVSRLAEHVGISFFFEHDSGKDVMVWSDDNSAFRDVASQATINFERRGERRGIFEVRGTTRALPAQVIVKDYNYRTPTVSLVKSAPIKEGGTGDIVEYGAHFKTPDEAQDIATVRAEEAFSTRRIFHGESDVPQLRVGGKFTLDGHPRAEPNLLVTKVRHHAVQVTFNYDTGAHDYENSFDSIPQSTKYRPRLTPKPKVHGSISGIVEAESPGQYAELDDDGRYHVRFMLDQGDAPRGKASSLIRMAQPHAGPGYGFHFPLRDGVEVVLSCIEGDPDRPIITGAVPNPTTPSTVGAGNGKRNVIKTGGGTELNIDDNESTTRFKVTVPFKNTVFQLGAPNAPGDGLWVTTDGNAQVDAKGWVDIKAHEYVSVQSTASNVSIHAGGGNLDETTEADATRTAKTSIHDKANGGDITSEAKANIALKANGGGIDAGAKALINIHSDAKIQETAPDVAHNGTKTFQVDSPKVTINGKITLIDGPTSVTIKSTSVVTIEAPKIEINGASVVNVGGSGATVNVTGSQINLNC